MEAQNIVRREVEPLCHSDSSKYQALAERRDIPNEIGTPKRISRGRGRNIFQEYFPVSVTLVPISITLLRADRDLFELTPPVIPGERCECNAREGDLGGEICLV